MPDPYGRALRDCYHNQQNEPLLDRHGNDVTDHSQVDSLYFNDFIPTGADDEWVASWLDGPLLDMGAGTGRHTLYFQDQFETVAIETSTYLVETMRDRGVADVRQADMFALKDEFDRDRFQSALAIGTQVGLAGSLQGLRQFLGDLAFVTMPDATVVLDSYHPDWTAHIDPPQYRHDPTPGLAYRIQQFQYEDDLSEPLLFRLFSPDRLREATVGTGWNVSEIRCHPSERDDAVQYRAALKKS